MTFQKIKQSILSINFVQILYLGLATFATLQCTIINPGEYPFTHYNNYVIFKQSFFHLIQNQDLYVYYNTEQQDLYKYSPTFSLLFGFFAMLPDFFGILLWNLLNAFCVFWAIKTLPKLSKETQVYILLFCAIEMMTSIQNTQANALIGGLIVLAFTQLEKRNYILASLFIVLTAYIKIFGIVAFAMYIFYPQKGKLIGYTIFWSILFLLLPLLFIELDQLKYLYESWFHLLQNDHDSGYGYSVMGWLHTWLSIDFSKNPVVLVGVLVFLLPLLRVKLYKLYEFRLLFLASILIWIIIFNHKAESPTFIIAVLGVGIWYFIQPKKFVYTTILLLLVFVFTSLSPTDICPRWFRDEIIKPYALKAVGCIFVWFYLIYYMLTLKADSKSPAIND